MSISDINKGASGVNPTADSILPSQTGNSGKVLKTDGVNASWDVYSPPPATPATDSVAGIVLLPKQITIANNATDANNDIDFSAGNFQFSDGSGIASLSALTKRLDASWTAGTNQGGLFSGTKANSTWYHCFAIYNPTSDVSDCGFDTSAIAANRPVAFTKYKRVGSIRANGSGNILQFIQAGQYFEYDASVTDHTPSPTSGVFTPYILTTPPVSGIVGNIFASQRYVGVGVVGLSISARRTGTSGLGRLIAGGAITSYTTVGGNYPAVMSSSSSIDIKFDFTAPTDSWTIGVNGYTDTTL